MTRYTITDATGVPVQIGLRAPSQEDALRTFGTRRVGGPYAARPETPGETSTRERAEERNRPHQRTYRGD